MSSVYVFNFGLNNLNNGRLSGVKAMPAKDLTSDADSSFASDRKAYANILATNTATPLPSQISQKKLALEFCWILLLNIAIYM